MLQWTYIDRGANVFSNYYFFFLWEKPRSGIVESYGCSIFKFLRNLHNIFHCACPSLHSHQICTNVPFSPHPCQHLFVVFVIIVILTDMRWYLTVVLICISLSVGEVEHFFMCLLALCMSYLQKNVYSCLLSMY